MASTYYFVTVYTMLLWSPIQCGHHKNKKSSRSNNQRNSKTIGSYIHSKALKQEHFDVVPLPYGCSCNYRCRHRRKNPAKKKRIKKLHVRVDVDVDIHARTRTAIHAAAGIIPSYCGPPARACGAARRKPSPSRWRGREKTRRARRRAGKAPKNNNSVVAFNRGPSCGLSDVDKN